MPTPLYTTDVQKIVDRTPKTALLDTDVFVVADEDGTLAPITKPNAKTTLGISDAESAISTIEGEIDDLQTAETAIKGTGWTDENLVDHETRITQNESDISALEQEVEEILQGHDLDPNKDTEVLAARVSSVTGITHPSIGDRMDGFEEKQNVFDDGSAVVGYMKYIARDGHLVIQTEDV